jgi:hypothetical protein
MTMVAGSSVKTFSRIALAGFAVFEFLVLLAAFTKPAYGYVDPGSGLLAVQVGGSMLAGGLFILRTKIRKLLRMSPKTEPKPESDK